MAYHCQADADEMFAWERAREAEGWASLAGYTDCNGNQFHSYEEACAYYGAESPAQLEAEEAYYAELEAQEAARDRRPRSVKPVTSPWLEADAQAHPDPDYCPF